MDFLETYSFNNYFIIFLYFSLAIFFILIGKLYFDYLNNISNNKNSRNNYLYQSLIPVIGIFIFGNILLVFNFFTGINKPLIYVGFFLVFIFSLIKNYKFLSSFKIFYINLIVLFISSTNIGISKDANLYHFQNQSWLRDEKIAMGLSNINPYLGYSSINEYINSLLWLDNNYILIHFISLYILGSLFELIYKFIRSDSEFLNKLGYIFLAIGILDNFGLGGGRNGFIFIQETFKNDHIFSSLSLIVLLLFFVTYKSLNDEIGITLLLIVFVFTLQTRFIGHLFFILFIFLIFKKRKIPLKKNLLTFIFYSLFVLKNIFYSSCLWFPVSFTCLKIVPWNQHMQAEYISKIIINTNKLPNSDATDKITFLQFIEHFQQTQINYIVNFLITLLIVIFIFIFLTRKILINKFQITLSIFLFLTWLFLAPTYRFGVPFFLAIYYIMSFSYIEKSKFIFLKKQIKQVSKPLYFLVLISILRIDSILELQDLNDINLIVERENIEFIQVRENWWLHPAEGDSFLCGDFKYCHIERFKSKKVDLNYGYFYFLPENMNYYFDILN